MAKTVPVEVVDNHSRLQVDKEFKSLIPELSEAEKRQLEANLLEEGCRDPLVVWKGRNVLLDGHNRHEICTRHGIEFKTVEIEISDRAEAKIWILQHQLGRRNLSPDQLSYYRGLLYISLKAQGKRTDLEGRENVSSVTSRQIGEKLSEQLAARFKVSSRTIERDARYAQDYETIATSIGIEARSELLNRGNKLNRKELHVLADVAETDPEIVKEAVRSSQGKSIVEQIRARTPVPISFRVGEVCQVITKGNPDLKGKGGCWCIVVDVYEFSVLIKMQGKEYQVKPENLDSVELSRQQQKEFKRNFERIGALYPKYSEEGAIIAMLDQWHYQNQYWISPVLDKVLQVLEEC